VRLTTNVIPEETTQPKAASMTRKSMGFQLVHIPR